MKLASFKDIDGRSVKVNPQAVTYIDSDPEGDGEHAILHLVDGSRVFVSVGISNAERTICNAG